MPPKLYKLFSDIADADKNKIKAWRAEFSDYTEGILQSGDIKAIGKNNAGARGLQTEVKLCTISIDNTKPTFRKLNVDTDPDTYSVYAKKLDDGSVEKYYINNTQGTFSISGLAEDPKGDEGDASGVEKVVLSISGAKGPNNTTSPQRNPEE